MKKTLLAISCLLFALLEKAEAQLMAHAGADSVWCTFGPNPPAPGVGGDPSAMGGTAPYTYQWNALNAATTYFISNTVANPVFSGQPPLGVDSVDYELVVTDATNAVARDTVRIFISHFICTLGECMRMKGVNDTVVLGTTCFAKLLPATYEWSPTQYINSSTDPAPKSWTPVDQAYNAIITDRKGCKATSHCAVMITGVGVPQHNNSKTGFSIAPNPVTRESIITLSDDYINGELTVYAADGRLIKKAVLSSKTTPLSDVANLNASGIYFYQFTKAGFTPVLGKLVGR